MKVHELYERVTQSITQQLEADTVPWTQPWRNGKNTGIELHGCGLKSFVAGALPPEFTCGLLLK